MANNYIKVHAKVEQSDDDGDVGVCALTYQRRVKKLAAIAPERQYRHGGTFSWVIPFDGDAVPELVAMAAAQLKADVEVAVGKGCANVSVWKASNGSKFEQIGEFKAA